MALTPPVYHWQLRQSTPYSSCRIPRIHTAAVWLYSGTPTRLPSRSLGCSMPLSRFTNTNPCRNMREGNTGRATKGKSPRLFRMKYREQDISDTSKHSVDTMRANSSGGDCTGTYTSSIPSGRTTPVRRASVRS
jgi:hypothetical protein